MDNGLWTDVGVADDLSQRPVQAITIGRTKVALTCKAKDSCTGPTRSWWPRRAGSAA